MVIDNVLFCLGKGVLYEGGIWVLMIICWLGIIMFNIIFDYLILMFDFYLILLEMVKFKGDFV